MRPARLETFTPQVLAGILPKAGPAVTKERRAEPLAAGRGASGEGAGGSAAVAPAAAAGAEGARRPRRRYRSSRPAGTDTPRLSSRRPAHPGLAPASAGAGGTAGVVLQVPGGGAGKRPRDGGSGERSWQRVREAVPAHLHRPPASGWPSCCCGRTGGKGCAASGSRRGRRPASGGCKSRRCRSRASCGGDAGGAGASRRRSAGSAAGSGLRPSPASSAGSGAAAAAAAAAAARTP